MVLFEKERSEMAYFNSQDQIICYLQISGCYLQILPKASCILAQGIHSFHNQV